MTDRSQILNIASGRWICRYYITLNVLKGRVCLIEQQSVWSVSQAQIKLQRLTVGGATLGPVVTAMQQICSEA